MRDVRDVVGMVEKTTQKEKQGAGKEGRQTGEAGHSGVVLEGHEWRGG